MSGATSSRFMAEQASETIRRPQSENDEPDIVFKDYDNGVLQPAYEPQAQGFTEYQGDVLVEVIAELRAEWQHDLDQRISALKNENAEIRGMLGSVLQI